jgi:hypothetical protein
LIQAKVVSDLRAALALAQNQAATAQLECAQARLEQRLQHSRSVDELPHDITNQESAEDLHSTMPSFQRSATMATSSQRTKSTRPSRTNDAIDDVKAQVLVIFFE